MAQNYESEIDLREYLIVLVRRWKTVAAITLGLGILALVFSLLQKPVYEAKTTVLLKSGGSNSALSQFAGLASIAGINLSSGGNSLQDLPDIVKSRAIAARVFEELKLNDRIDWGKKNVSEQLKIKAVQNMLKEPKISGNLVELKVEYTDPALAAELANSFVDALAFYWNKLNYTEARKKREYIDSQLPRVELDLKAAESRLKAFTLISPRAIGNSSNLLGSIGASQPQGIEISRLSREFDIQNSIYTMLRKEYEQVKLEESKEIPPFSIVDRAVKPEFKIKPKIKLNIFIGLALGLFAGTFWAFFQEYWEKSSGGKK